MKLYEDDKHAAKVLIQCNKFRLTIGDIHLEVGGVAILQNSKRVSFT